MATFAAKQVCAALGVPHGTLNSWAHAGYFHEFDAAITIPGKARKFSLDDLFYLSIMIRLIDLGFSVKTARSLSKRCLSYMENSPTKIRMLVYDDDREEILLNDQEVGPGATIEVSIFPQAIVAELKRRLAAADDPKVAAMSRRRFAGERAPNRAARTGASEAGRRPQ
jgi:DNA-binding transcriptional MerR regulator